MGLVVSTALSALFGGGVAILVTIAIERLGGKVGGILASSPSTIIPATAAFILSADTAHDARVALFSTPCGMLINSVFFLSVWKMLPPKLPKAISVRRRLALVLAASLLSWALSVAAVWVALAVLNQHGVSVITVGPICAVVSLVAGIAACMRSVPSPKGRHRVATGALLSRGLLAGISIGVANLLSATGNVVLAGFAAVFPSIFLSTMASLWLAQGEAVPTGATGPMMLGSTSVSAFAILAGVLNPHLPLAAILVVCYAAAVLCVSLPSLAFLRWRRAAVAAAAGMEEGGAAGVELRPKGSTSDDDLESPRQLSSADSLVPRVAQLGGAVPAPVAELQEGDGGRA